MHDLTSSAPRGLDRLGRCMVAAEALGQRTFASLRHLSYFCLDDFRFLFKMAPKMERLLSKVYVLGPTRPNPSLLFYINICIPCWHIRVQWMALQ